MIQPFFKTVVEGRFIILRQFQESDITKDYLAWLNDPLVVRYSGQRFKVHTVESCQKYLSAFTGTDNCFFAICDKNSLTVVGTLTVYYSQHHKTADIGIMIGNRSLWGKGYGLDAFQSIVDALHDARLVRKITAGTLVINLGMTSILQRAGFHLEATRKQHELFDGVPVDMVYYAKFFHD